MFTEIVVSEEQAEYIVQEPSSDFWLIVPPPISDSKLITHREKVLIGIIYGLMSKRGYCYASNEWIADKMGDSKRTIQSIIASLCEKGVLRVELVKNEKGVVIQRRIYPLGFMVHVGGVVKKSSWGGEEIFMGVVKKSSRNNIKKEYKEEYIPLFEKFWSAYPRKVSKKEALKAFMRLEIDGSLFDRILSSLKQQCAAPAWQRDGGKYIPHAATWLNGERWNDELAADAPAAQTTVARF